MIYVLAFDYSQVAEWRTAKGFLDQETTYVRDESDLWGRRLEGSYVLLPGWANKSNAMAILLRLQMSLIPELEQKHDHPGGN